MSKESHKLEDYLVFLILLRDKYKKHLESNLLVYKYICPIAHRIATEYEISKYGRMNETSFFMYWIQQGIIKANSPSPERPSIMDITPGRTTPIYFKKIYGVLDSATWVGMSKHEKLAEIELHISKIETLLTQPKIIYNKGKVKSADQTGRFIRLKDAMDKPIRNRLIEHGISLFPHIKQLAIIDLDFKKGYSQVDVKNLRLASNNEPIL